MNYSTFSLSKRVSWNQCEAFFLILAHAVTYDTCSWEHGTKTFSSYQRPYTFPCVKVKGTWYPQTVNCSLHGREKLLICDFLQMLRRILKLYAACFFSCSARSRRLQTAPCLVGHRGGVYCCFSCLDTKCTGWTWTVRTRKTTKQADSKTVTKEENTLKTTAKQTSVVRARIGTSLGRKETKNSLDGSLPLLTWRWQAKNNYVRQPVTSQKWCHEKGMQAPREEEVLWIPPWNLALFLLLISYCW